MTKFYLGINTSTKQLRLSLTAGGIAAFTKIGEFDHEAQTDVLGFSVNHVLFQHIQDIVYHWNEANPSQASFFPDNITDLQKYAIIFDEPTAVTGLTQTGSLTRELDVGQRVSIPLTVAPATAYLRSYRVSSSDVLVASAEIIDGGVAIVGNRPGKAKVVVQTNDGNHTLKFDVTVHLPTD